MSKFTATGEFQVPKLRHITPEGTATLISALPSTLTISFDDETQVQLLTFLEEKRPNIGRRSLQVDTSADTMDQAHEKAFSAMEWLTDYTAFMLHQPVYWELTHMTDHGSNQRQVGTHRPVRGLLGGARTLGTGVAAEAQRIHALAELQMRGYSRVPYLSSLDRISARRQRPDDHHVLKRGMRLRRQGRERDERLSSISARGWPPHP